MTSNNKRRNSNTDDQIGRGALAQYPIRRALDLLSEPNEPNRELRS